jgi:hypothetical protein
MPIISCFILLPFSYVGVSTVIVISGQAIIFLF